MSTGSQPKRRRIETYSSSASASNLRSTSHPKKDRVGEKDRLVYVFNNLSNEKIAKTLKEAVQKSGEKLPRLTTIFDKKKFPAKVCVMLTCTRCGREFDPNYNDDTSCKILHPDWECVGKTYPHGYRCTWQCTSCDMEWETNGGELDDIVDDPDREFCYVGQHTIEEEPDTDTDSD